MYDWQCLDAGTGETLSVPNPLKGLSLAPTEVPNSLAPDHSLLLWEDQRRESGSDAPLNAIRLTRVSDGGQVRVLQLTRSEHPWYWTHIHKDRGDTTHWLAEHFRWIKGSDGRFDVEVTAGPTP
jgi:hypothetical protein